MLSTSPFTFRRYGLSCVKPIAMLSMLDCCSATDPPERHMLDHPEHWQIADQCITLLAGTMRGTAHYHLVLARHQATVKGAPFSGSSARRLLMLLLHAPCRSGLNAALGLALQTLFTAMQYIVRRHPHITLNTRAISAAETDGALTTLVACSWTMLVTCNCACSQRLCSPLRPQGGEASSVAGSRTYRLRWTLALGGLPAPCTLVFWRHTAHPSI